MPTFYISKSANPRSARHIATFVALSLLIHGLLFFVFAHWQREDLPRAAQASASPPISVRLLEAAPAAARPSAPVARAAPPRRPKPPAKPAIAKNKRTHPALAKVEPPAPPKESADAHRAPEPQMDMLSMLNAARERRRAAQQDLQDNAQEESQSNNIALANINRDLQRSSGRWTGVGGVFRIVSKGVRTAQFQFLGWNPGSGNRWSQTIEVDAGPNGDVELATVQKMIELIRSHYSGDFNWESHRLGRVLVLSARPDDNAALQAFLMREFFGG